MALFLRRLHLHSKQWPNLGDYVFLDGDLINISVFDGNSVGWGSNSSMLAPGFADDSTLSDSNARHRLGNYFQVWAGFDDVQYACLRHFAFYFYQNSLRPTPFNSSPPSSILLLYCLSDTDLLCPDS